MSIRVGTVSNAQSAENAADEGRLRRRGVVLENALLDAAWEELISTGYGGYTIEAVALRAHTSRAVLYRRWSSRAALAMAVIRDRLTKKSPAIPDTGDLRNDLIGYLSEISSKRLEMMVLFSFDMAEFFSETKLPLGELREKLLEGRPSGISVILERAIARGQIDRKEFPRRLLQVPINLLGYEMLLSGTQMPNAAIVEIVDTIFLPLILG